jgi:hypothetical protein
VIVGFVDMCGIVGYHCLNSLFIYKIIGNKPVLDPVTLTFDLENQ